MPTVQGTSTKSTRASKSPERESNDSRTGGNKRYVGFIVVGDIPQRGKLIHLINRSTRRGEQLPWLSFFEERMGVIRCTDKNRDTVVGILERVKDLQEGISLTPLITSGTIKQVKNYLKEYLSRHG